MRQFIWGEGFVSILHGVLSSPLIRKQSVNCEVKVKTKIENSLCARYAQARVYECYARADLMIDYEEKVNGATISMRERLTK